MKTMTDRETISTYLTDLWSTMLSKQPDTKDDFFELGGNSLTAIKMIMNVQSDLKVELAAETFLEDPSIENLTNCIIKAKL